MRYTLQDDVLYAILGVVAWLTGSAVVFLGAAAVTEVVIPQLVLGWR